MGHLQGQQRELYHGEQPPAHPLMSMLVFVIVCNLLYCIFVYFFFLSLVEEAGCAVSPGSYPYLTSLVMMVHAQHLYIMQEKFANDVKINMVICTFVFACASMEDTQC